MVLNTLVKSGLGLEFYTLRACIIVVTGGFTLLFSIEEMKNGLEISFKKNNGWYMYRDYPGKKGMIRNERNKN